MMLLALLPGLAILSFLALSRAHFLSRSSAGWAMYLPNVVLDTMQKRVRLHRNAIDAVAAAAGCILVGIGSSPGYGLASGLAYSALVLHNLVRERSIMNAVNGQVEVAGLRRSEAGTERFPGPCLHPDLTVTLVGPFVRRMPDLDLGVLAAGHGLRLDVLVGNHGRVPLQRSVDLEVVLPPGWALEGGNPQPLPALRPGEVRRVELCIVTPNSAGPSELVIQAISGRSRARVAVRVAEVRRVTLSDVRSASVTRYPGARRSAFSLRGDFDLYDEQSFQSIAGLEDAFGLSARYGIAQSMYLSTRLAIDRDSAEEWARHYQVDRGASSIPAFVDWMARNVDIRLSAPYPASGDRRFVIEVGNHGHLHYDTDASGHPGNRWKAGAKPGQGRYPWQGEDGSSFGDQRDNILEAALWCERLLGFRPRSWAKPGRGNDAHSPAAVAAAGCEVATGSDIGPEDNVLRQAPPHHPGSTRIVEITARYPSDPQHVHHCAMLEFWIWRAHRLGIPAVVLVHQHMRQFDGIACSRFTEHLLRMVTGGFRGDLYLDTVYGIGRYWLDVLSPMTRCVSVGLSDSGVVLTNGTGRRVESVPVDLVLRDGARMTILVDAEPGSNVIFDEA
jgi:hypothetical protein